MCLRSWEDHIDDDFPALPPITAKVREQMRNESDWYRSSARMANGHVWEDEEYENFRREELETPLP
jgi:hypothetical protein